jgi:hypothetical protein
VVAGKINLLQNKSNNQDLESLEKEIAKQIDRWADRSTDNPVANKEAALKWLKYNEKESRNEEWTDKKGRTDDAKKRAVEAKGIERINETKRILLENPEIETPKDLNLGLKITPLGDDVFLSRAISYIESGWHPNWTEKKIVDTKRSEEKLSDGMYFENSKEAHEFAKNTAINNKICVTVISKDNGYFVKILENS